MTLSRAHEAAPGHRNRRIGDRAERRNRRIMVATISAAVLLLGLAFVSPTTAVATGEPVCIMHHGIPSEGHSANTYVALDDATADGYSIKTDIQVTSDGVVVVYHDPQLSWQTTGTGSVGSHSWYELTLLRYHSGGHIASLNHALDALAGNQEQALVELKPFTTWSDTNMAAVHNLIAAHGALDRVVVMSSSWDLLRHIRQTWPDLRTAYRMDTLAPPATIPADIVFVTPGFATATWISSVHAAGRLAWIRRGLTENVLAAVANGVDGVMIGATVNQWKCRLQYT